MTFSLLCREQPPCCPILHVIPERISTVWTSAVFDALVAAMLECIAAPIIADVKRKLRNRQPDDVGQLFDQDLFYQ